MSGLDARAGEDFAADWDVWHKQHEDRLAAPDGFLAITSINWLTETPTRFPDAPGEWAADGDGITVRLAAGEELTLDGAGITGRHHFGQIPERGGLFPSDAGGVYEVAKRGGNDILRPRHPDNPLRTGFRGTPAYAPDPRWVIRGRYRPFDEPRDVVVGSVVEGLQHVYAAPGVVEFEVGGQPLALTAFNGHDPGQPAHPVHRCDQRRHHVPRQSVAAGGGARRGRHGHPGLQPGDQPAVRVHRVRDLPAPAGGEPPSGGRRGGRADAL